MRFVASARPSFASTIEETLADDLVPLVRRRCRRRIARARAGSSGKASPPAVARQSYRPIGVFAGNLRGARVTLPLLIPAEFSREREREQRAIQQQHCSCSGSRECMGKFPCRRARGLGGSFIYFSLFSARAPPRFLLCSAAALFVTALVSRLAAPQPRDPKKKKDPLYPLGALCAEDQPGQIEISCFLLLLFSFPAAAELGVYARVFFAIFSSFEDAASSSSLSSS